MTAFAPTDWRRHTSEACQPHPRTWPTPGALARALDHTTRDSLALQVIDRELVKTADHQVDAGGLMIFMSPQEGKSQRVSRRFPLWLLAHDPSLRIAIVSYEQESAVRWGRQILRDIRSADPAVLDVQLMADSSAAGRWDTREGGGVYCVGVGGALTGRPVDVLPLLIIDDPVKGREEAESEIIRSRAWDWWENVALTRLASNGVAILMMTRWHEMDLAGAILARPSPMQWRILKIPAISHGKGDPLGRPEGAEMPSVRDRPPGYFTHRRATTTPYVWSSIFDQQPTAAVGNFFRRQAFRYWRTVTGQPDPALILGRPHMTGAWIELEGRRRVDLTDPGVWRFATCDVAASEKTSADYTVVSVWCIDREGDLILLDRARGQIEMANHFDMAKPLRDRWHYDVLYVEHSFYSKTLVIDARTNGVPVAEVQADTDKVTRAIPAAGRLHSGKCWFPAAAPWLSEWEDELASFPRGAHDDQVDCFSYAARIAAAHWTPPPPPSRPAPVGPDLERIASAYAAGTGNGDHHVDIMKLPLG